jgi:hypothetical protein
MDSSSGESSQELCKIFTSLFVDQVNSQDTNAVLISQEHV